MTEKASRFARLGLSALSGVMLYLAVPTVGAWPLMWIALAPQLHVALTSRSGRNAFLHGWLTGTIANTLAGLLAGAAAGVFPVMLRSTLPAGVALTAHDGAQEQGLRLALLWWPIAALLAAGYFVLIVRDLGATARGDDATPAL